MNDAAGKIVPDGTGISAPPGETLSIGIKGSVGAGAIHVVPPTLDDLEPGEEWLVQLQRNQLGPSFPPRPCAYRYFRAGSRLFRTVVEEVF